MRPSNLSDADRAASASSSPSSSENELRASWDALSPALMRSRGSLKWTQSPVEATHEDAIGAWVAEMDLGIAAPITASVAQTLKVGSAGYPTTALSKATRDAFLSFAAEEYHWEIEPRDVSLVAGVLNALQAIIERHTTPGSAVIVPTPAYMPFLSIPTMLGREVIEVPSRVTPAGWELNLEGLEAAMSSGAGLLILCNPWNPVGRVLSAQELDSVARLSARYGTGVFADEIHAPLILEPGLPHLPYALRPDADPALTYTATSATKGWNIPGLPCAQLIISGQARQAWDDDPVAAFLGHGSPIVALGAGRAAYDEAREWNAAARRYLREVTVTTAKSVNAIDGLSLTTPQGSYLSWLDCRELALPEDISPSTFFARKAGIYMNDGAAFGRGYEGFARLNLATGRGIATEIVERLSAAVTSLH